VLALDDVQWADSASTELLAHLLRHPTQASMLVAMAVRSGQLPSSLAAALETRDREGSGKRLVLAPLSLEALSGLIGAELDRWTLDRSIAKAAETPSTRARS
jgi:predicted ATPase